MKTIAEIRQEIESKKPRSAWDISLKYKKGDGNMRYYLFNLQLVATKKRNLRRQNKINRRAMR